MATRLGAEQDIAANRRTIADLEKQIQEIRQFITTSEQTWQNASEPLRTITQESLTKARANLAQQELELQRARVDLDRNLKIFANLEASEKLRQTIDQYSELLEKARNELSQKEQELLELTNPVSIPAYELVAAGGARVPLPTDRSNLLVGCRDQANNIYPDVDLTPLGGQTSGASRKHARIAFQNGQWTITDLESVNGTFVNEGRLAPNVPTLLPDRAQLRFGRIAVSFQPAVSNQTVRLS